jgi:hypothetical protein
MSDAIGLRMQKIGTLGQARSARYRLPDFPRPSITPRVGNLKLEIDDLERRAIERSLAERRSRLRRGRCDRDRAVVSVRSCGILSLPLRVAQPSSGPALTQRPPKWHVFYNRFMLTINQRMRNVFKGRHGLRVKAKLEAAFG